jgi:hypothetical protein
MQKSALVFVMLVAPIAATCDDVPILDVAESCRIAAADADVAPTSIEHCLAQEHGARAELAQAWSQFDRRDLRLCTAASTAGGLASYVELLTCVTMARDARRLSTQGRAAE